MIFQTESSDYITYRYSNILGTIKANNFEPGLVDYLSKFGSLYFGNLKSSLFKEKYFKIRNSNISNLINVQTITDPGRLQNVRFNLHMLRRAQNESWKLPGLLTETTRELHWGCGSSRTFASGMCHENAYQQVKFLILQQRLTDPETYLENPILISTDDQLHRVLNISTQKSEIPLIQLQLNIIPEHTGARLVLSSISDWDPDDHQLVGQSYFDDFVEWQQLNGKTPTINIYTDWPEKITNGFNAWNINFAGPSLLHKEKIHTYGTLELLLYNKNNNAVTNEHNLFVLSPRSIELADLLFWVNNKYTAFVEKNLDFVLFKKQSTYLTTQINVSTVSN